MKKTALPALLGILICSPGFAANNGPNVASKGIVPPTVKPQFTWTLTDVRKMAEDQNPDVKTAKSNYEAASKVALESVSGYLPRVDLEGYYEQTNLPYPSAGLTGQLGIVLPYSAIVARAHQLLFDFGKTINEIAASRALSHSAEQDAVAVKEAVDLGVQKAFYNVSASEKLVDVAQKGVQMFQETHRRTEVLVKTGTRPSFDLTQANVELSQAKLNLISAENARDLAKITLLNIMGMTKQVTFTLVEPPFRRIKNLDKFDTDDLANRAFANRPEMKRSRFEVEAAQNNLHSKFKDYLPSVGIEGWYGKYMPNYPVSINDAWGGGLTLTWNLFDGLKTTWQVGEYSARLDASEAQLEKQQENILAEVNKSFMDLKKNDSNLDVANESYTFAKENARLARRRYEVSVATFLELLVADTSLLNAEAQQVQAQYNYAIALASLERAINGPLE